MIALLLNSCVDDDSFFPEENNGVITNSSAVVTILNELRSIGPGFDQNQLCFKFVYPIYLGYNNDSSIRVDDFEGLINVIGAQSSNFNVTGLQFPFEVIFNTNDVPSTISNEDDFINLLRECEITTLRDDFDRFFNDCFKLDFPVTLLQNNAEEVLLNSADDFSTFYNMQAVNYQPQFKFPVTVLVAPNFEPVTINSYFGFYRVLDTCDRCPELSFASEPLNPVTLEYIFVADFADIELVETYSWLIDGQFIENDGPANNGDNRLEFQFNAPGTYRVCISSETPDCPQGVEFCKDIVVESFCPNLFFEFEQETGTLGYNFTANFEGINNINYEWVIDNEVIELDGGVEGDNQLFSNLTPGEHIVCIKAETNACPGQLLEFCQEIVVEAICPDLFFTVEQEGNTSSYIFTADFNGMDTIVYDWTVNGNTIESDGGPTGDNVFTFQFDQGTFQVCIFAETDSCPNGTQFCEEIVVQ